MVKTQQDSEYKERKTLKLGTERDSDIRGIRDSNTETVIQRQWYRDTVVWYKKKRVGDGDMFSLLTGNSNLIIPPTQTQAHSTCENC